MKGLLKKVVALAAVTTMAMTALIGCGAKSVDNNEVVAVVNDTEITAGVANFYIRYQQSAIETAYASMLGADMWSLQLSEESDETYEESTKANMIEDLQEMYVLMQHMADYNITLTDDEVTAIDAAAAAFVEENSADILAKISGEKENVAEVLKLLAISDKMYDAMVADVSTEVSDDEAAQKKLQYVRFAKSTTDENGATKEMTEEEIADVKAEAEAFLAEAKSTGSLEALAGVKELKSYPLTFDSKSTTIDEKVIKAADALGENEYAEVIDTDAGFYVIQLTSLFDREATDAKKESIVAERQNEKYNLVLEGFVEAAETSVNEDVLAKISLHGLAVTAKIEKKEDK